MIIVEKRYVGSDNVWRTLFASKWAEIPDAAKFDRIIFVSFFGGHSPGKEAEEWVRRFKPVCDVCRAMDVDSEPHPDWAPIGA